MLIAKVLNVTHHRNGVCGEPFVTVLFVANAPDNHTMHGRVFLATRFDDPEHKPGDFVNPRCAVVRVGDLMDVAGGTGKLDCWRGDHFVEEVDRAIRVADRKLLKGA